MPKPLPARASEDRYLDHIASSTIRRNHHLAPPFDYCSSMNDLDYRSPASQSAEKGGFAKMNLHNTGSWLAQEWGIQISLSEDGSASSTSCRLLVSSHGCRSPSVSPCRAKEAGLPAVTSKPWVPDRGEEVQLVSAAAVHLSHLDVLFQDKLGTGRRPGGHRDMSKGAQDLPPALPYRCQLHTRHAVRVQKCTLEQRRLQRHVPAASTAHFGHDAFKQASGLVHGAWAPP